MNLKVLLSIVALGCLSAMQIVAYTHTVINTTDYPVVVRIEYVACRSDENTIAPGKSWDNNGAGCILSRISATVNYSGMSEAVKDLFKTIKTRGIEITQFADLFQTRQIVATPYDGPYTGSSKWIVYGSLTYGFHVTRL